MQFRIEVDAIFEADDLEHAYKFWEDHYRALSIHKNTAEFMGNATIREMVEGEPRELLKTNVRYYPRKVGARNKG